MTYAHVVMTHVLHVIRLMSHVTSFISFVKVASFRVTPGQFQGLQGCCGLVQAHGRQACEQGPQAQGRQAWQEELGAFSARH